MWYSSTEFHKIHYSVTAAHVDEVYSLYFVFTVGVQREKRVHHECVKNDIKGVENEVAYGKD